MRQTTFSENPAVHHFMEFAITMCGPDLRRYGPTNVVQTNAMMSETRNYTARK